MGKLMHNTQIKHSSHPHLLQLSPIFHLVPNQQQASCAGCNLQISAPDDMIYTCRPCNFFLHPSCSKFPQAITHPSHHAHPLSLLPTPIYPGGFFHCDACTHQGIRFSYHCHYCDFDLHVLCASKPLSVNHSFHPHPLVLTFSSPYGEKVGFSCDVCHTAGSSDQWLYRCVSCEFDVHLHCATSKMQPSLQHNSSFPGAAHGTQSNQQFVVAGQPLSHSMSTGHVQTYCQPQNLASTIGFQTYQQQPIQQQPPISVQTYHHQQPIQQQPAIGVQAYQQQQQPIQQQPPIGVQTYQMQQQQPIQQQQTYQMQQPQGQNVGPAGNGSLGEVMVNGFVDGIMQQLGQNLMQNLTGSGGGGGGGGGGSGGGGCGNDGGNNDYGGNNECESTTSYDDY